MLESATELNDLFDLFDIRVATVDVVTYSSDGGKEGLCYVPNYFLLFYSFT